MKQIKKLFQKAARIAAAGSIAAVSLAAMPAATASASTLYGDVNNDGSVNITDSVSLNRYLAGMIPASDINMKYTDVDKNMVIDVNDSKVLSGFLVQTVSTLPYSESGNTFNYSASSYTMPADGLRSYAKYVCSTGKRSSYQLQPASSASATSGGEDDRVLDSSANAQCIVYLSYTDGSGVGYRGSGFIVDDHVIATCAHCLYDGKTNTFNTNYKVKVYNAAGTSVVATYDAKELHVPNSYIGALGANPEDSEPVFCYDYGLIYVEEDLSAYGKMGLGAITDKFPYTSQEVYVSGFPGEVDGVGDNVHGRYVGAGNIAVYTDSTYEPYRVTYSSYASGGDSGGPVYLEYTLNGSTFRSAIGIHTSGNETGDVHSGTRITLPVLRFYQNNSNIG